jgi:hypothetical protein
MQPVTVAISPTGVEYLLQTLIGNQVAKALEDNLTPPNYSFAVPDFTYEASDSQFEFDYSGITISLSKGSLKSFTPVFGGCVQGPDDNSQFTITMTVSSLEVD